MRLTDEGLLLADNAGIAAYLEARAKARRLAGEEGLLALLRETPAF